jgi:steroid delta-isomerase-like uncharacterized protein
MSTEENKALYRRLLEGVMNQRNLALVDELCAPDFVLHRGSTTMQGREPYKQFLSMYLTGGPDFHLTIEDQIAEGDKVVSRFTGRGTHLGPFMGIPPTGKHVTATGIGIIRVANGKIVEEWANGDDLGVLQQLGVVPVPGQETR